VTTRSTKGDKLYVHVLDPKATEVKLPKAAGKLTAARLLHGEKVEATESGADLVVKLPAKDRDPIDTIVVLETVQN
jgi:hypothetical protein